MEGGEKIMRRTKGLYKRGQIYWTAIKVDGELYREKVPAQRRKKRQSIPWPVVEKRLMRGNC